MPSLKQITTEKVYLPSTADLANEADRVWFELKTTLLLSDYAMFVDETNPTEQAIALLLKVIVDWNLNEADDVNQKLPITKENIDIFAGQNMTDFAYISEYISDKVGSDGKGLTTDEKKSSSSTSIPVTAVVPPLTI